MSSLPLQPKKCLIFLDFPMKNVVKILGIPMSSFRGCASNFWNSPFYFEQGKNIAQKLVYENENPHTQRTCMF